MLRLGPRARDARRELGPTAWIVLEELVVSAADGRGDPRRVNTNVRSLARELGLAKDTVAAALRRLSGAGFVRREPQTRSRAGGFGTYVYLLETRALEEVISCTSPASSARVHPKGRARRDAEQAVLFSLDEAAQ